MVVEISRSICSLALGFSKRMEEAGDGHSSRAQLPIGMPFPTPSFFRVLRMVIFAETRLLKAYERSNMELHLKGRLG